MRGPIKTGPPILSGHFVVSKFAALHVVLLDSVTVHVGGEIVRVSFGLIERRFSWEQATIPPEAVPTH